MSRDRDYNRLIHSGRWLNLRRSVLSEQPCCFICQKEGYDTAATEVHHRTPVETALTLREKETLMFDRSNLMALCHGCHVKIHMEMGRYGKDAAKRRNSDQAKAFNEKFFGK